MTAPTFVQEYEGNWASSTSPQTASITVNGSEDLVLVCATEDSAQTIPTPTGGTGITWVLKNSVVVSGFCATYLYTAEKPPAQTFTLSVARSSTGLFGFNCLKFSGSDGIGATSKTNAAGGAPSLGLTTTQADSAIVAISTDWQAVDGASRVWRTVNGITPTSGNGLEATYFRDAAKYTVYAARWNDAGVAGSKTVGLSAPSGQDYAIISVEVKGTSSGSAITKTPADNLGLTDALSRVMTRLRSPADNLGLTDAIARTMTRLRSPADNLGLTDTITRTMTRLREPSDQLGLTDAVTIARARTQALADDLGLTDAVTIARGLGRAAADNLGLTDAVSMVLARLRSPSDNLGLTDQVSVAVARARGATDQLGITDSVVLTQEKVRAPGDTIGLTDQITLTKTMVINIGDTLGLSDQATAQVAGAGQQTIGDALGLTDTITITMARHLTIGDMLGLTDQEAHGRGRTRVFTDALGLSDAIAHARALARSFTDALGLTDAVSLPAGNPLIYAGDDVVSAIFSGDDIVSAVYGGDVQVWP